MLRLSFGSGNFKEPDYLHANVMAQLDAIERRVGVDARHTTAPERFGHLIRDWYNGYGWPGEERVYNPFDILLLFDRRRFEAHWFETGTPKFLVETLCKRQVRSLDLDDMVGSNELLSTFDVGDIATEALLFQTGYLTIKDDENLGGTPLYRLDYPNREVRQSLNERLLRYLVKDASRQMKNSVRLYRLLEANDFAGLETLFHAFFASIPHEWYTNNEIARYEGADKYRALGRPIYLIGVEFSRDDRNLAAFDVERA